MVDRRVLNVQKKPNPQGKGVVPVLRDWSTMQTGVLGAKSNADFLRDYCISSLVLSAAFAFKPVVAKTYFLYAREQTLSLSLVAPQEWGNRSPGEFLTSCRLRSDMTWEIDTAELDESSNALATARQFVRNFVVTMAKQNSICDNLPFYVRELPYYQRILATALASSLKRSLPIAGDDINALLREPVPLLAPSLPRQTAMALS